MRVISTPRGASKPTPKLRWWVLTAGVARTADEMAAPALLVTLLASAYTPQLAGLCTAALTATAGLAGPVVGARLDASVSPWRFTSGAMTWMALMMLTLGLTAGLNIALTLALAILTGLAAPVVSGGWTSQLPAVVPSTALARATAWDAATYNIAGIIGPALVTLVGVALSESWSISVAGGIMLLAVPLISRLRTDNRRRIATAPTSSSSSPIPSQISRDATTGVRVLWANKALRRATIITTIGHMGMGSAFLGMPLRVEELGLPLASGGLLLASFAAGALLGTLAAGHPGLNRQPDRLVTLGTIGLGLGLTTAATMPTAATTATCLLMSGSCEGLLFTGLLAVRHRDAPQRYRAQVFTTGASLKIGAYALGMSLIGMAAREGQTLLVAAGALQILAVGTALLLSPRVRMRATN